MSFEGRELVFMCHPIKKAVGGVKVIYRHAELAHRLLQPMGHSASVLHPNTWFFRVKWFENEVRIRRKFFKWRWMGKPSLSDLEGCFDPSRHLVVIPELWARKYGDQLARMGVTYAIYVQNGYYINKGDPVVLDVAYAGARCILTVSEDATRCVAMAFPAAEPKILRVHCFVNAKRFNADRPKENLITYMPRKLADHSSKVLFFLRNHLPAHWRIQAIDGMNEAGVADLLQRSKIFMSFSHFEGLGLPPIEAALSGNQVIGYTGQGGKEYWMPEIFEAIESGDVVGFAQAVLRKVQALEALPHFPLHEDAMRRLSELYSAECEAVDVRRFISMMGVMV
jgi:predicted nuclease of predicted toxin-antitoxin system